MHRYTRYIIAQLIGPFVVVTLSLTGIVWLTQSLRFIDLIVNKGLSIGLFFTLTALLTPSVIGIIMPISLFASTLYVYHRLTIDSEIVVLRATGLSNWQLAAPAVALAIMVMAAVLAINLYLMPAGFRAFKDKQFEIRNSYASVLLQEGVFNTPVEGLTIYVRQRESSGELRGIMAHDERDPVEPATLIAERGTLVSTPDGPRFVLANGSRQQIDVQSGTLSMLYFDSYAFDFGPMPDFGPGRFREAKERYFHELLNPGPGAEERHVREFAAEAHSRLVGSLVPLVLALIATAFLLPGEFNRRGEGWRIMAAIGAAIAFLGVVFGMRGLIVREPWLAPLYYLVTLAVGAAAAYVVAGGWRPRARARTRPAFGRPG
jgi:lipopolysaccharide export system permease protein